jgi:hypothetical protein
MLKGALNKEFNDIEQKKNTNQQSISNWYEVQLKMLQAERATKEAELEEETSNALDVLREKRSRQLTQFVGSMNPPNDNSNLHQNYWVWDFMGLLFSPSTKHHVDEV